MSKKTTPWLVIIDDQESKSRRIEKAAESLGIRSVTFKALNSAIDFIQRKHVAGIVTDMSFFMYENNPESLNKNAGNVLLEWLAKTESKIPVLGNSSAIGSFRFKYDFFLGEMPGFFRADIFLEFVAFIKDRD